MAALVLPAFAPCTALTETQFESGWGQHAASSGALTNPTEMSFEVPFQGGSYRVRVRSRVLPKWVVPAISSFMEMQNLRDNWNSYGAKRIKRDLISQSLNVLGQIMEQDSPAPSVVPLSDGGLQLEWHRKQQDLEIVFPADETPSFIYQNRATGEQTEGYATDVFNLAQLLRNIA
jgi:hypothetical protein